MANLKSTFFIIIAFFAASYIPTPCEAGTACPARSELYPCMCMNVPQSKTQVYTVVTCRHVPNKSSLSSIFLTLRSMRIDKFVMYDSFWDSVANKEVQKQLPENFLTLLMIREIEIHDSELSSCFACDINTGCPNRFIHKLSILNSTSSDDGCPTCNKRRWWTACVPELKTFDFSGNKLKSIDRDMFMQNMPKVTHLNFSHNEISIVGDEAFKNLPKVLSIDLSHNAIKNLSANIFAVSSSLTYLDLSHNFLTTLSSNIFKFTPNLRTLSAANNLIRKVLHDDWKHLSREIRIVDLSGNPLHCDCHMVWLNCTTKVHVQFRGYCSNDGFDTTPLRRVSKYVSERCVNDQLQEKRINKTTELTACQKFLQKQETVQLLDLNRVAPNRRDRKPVVTPKTF